jgi:predicted SAM-dependent methyltransferase
VRRYLNVGCGERFHPFWTNIDCNRTDERIILDDVRRRIPFPNNSFDVIYHSHLLEHFEKYAAKQFLKECHRVLSPGGIIRIVVPDLEQIVRTYLELIDAPDKENPKWRARHQWMIMEMYDQTVRTRPGGEFGSLVLKENLDRDFVLRRWGGEARRMFHALEKEVSSQQRLISAGRSYEPIFIKFLKRIYHGIRSLLHPKEALLKALLGPEYSLLQVVRFRESGEIHQWMYDRYSLGNLLEKTDFIEVIEQTASRSRIPNWIDFCLDTEADGSVYKPDSLFIEAVKPS